MKPDSSFADAVKLLLIVVSLVTQLQRNKDIYLEQNITLSLIT